MILCLFLVFLAIPIRGDIPFQLALQVTTPIMSLYMPVLTAFAMFWFRPGKTMSRAKLSGERWYVALALTLTFQLLMLGGMVTVVYFVRNPPDSDVGLTDHVAALIHWISIFSPLATAPSAFLLGVEKIDPA